LIATIAATCLVILLLALESRHQSDAIGLEESRLFQRTIGGLGMGATPAPAWNLLHFDPRLQSIDDSNLWPVPGGYPYSPTAASAAVGLREMPQEDLKIIKVDQ
jgi:hypothetical protein